MVMPKERDPNEEKKELKEMVEVQTEKKIEKELTLEEPTATSGWIPKTALGNDVLKGKFGSLEQVLRKGELILEPIIIDHLIPDVEDARGWLAGLKGQ